MKEMKRVLALVLCFVMLVGALPVGALAAETETTAPSETVAEAQATEATEAAADTEASEIETSAPETTAVTEADVEEAAYYEADAPAVYSASDNIDYLFIATDRHANTTIIGNIIDNMESNIEDQLDYLALGGDMVGSGNSHPEYNSSTVLAEVTGAADYMSASNVDIVAGIHDMNVNDDAGIVLTYKGGSAQIYEGSRYYVYGVEEYCISDDSGESYWTTEAEKFVNWANSVEDTSKAIIVVSHYPLHAKRDDNDGAYIWHTALNDVATNDAGEVVRDVVFFHGHNHTVDSNEYVYNVGDTMSIQNGSSTTSETIQYTYATAGYLNQNSKATLVTITDSTICLDKYTTSGVGETMASVTRVAEEVEEETTAPTETEPAETEATEPEAVAPSKVEVSGTDTYTQGDDLTITVKGYTYSVDGTTSVDIALADCEIAISCPEGHDCTLDTVMDTVATGTDNDYHQITVTYMGVDGSFMFTVGAAEELKDETTGVTVSVNSAVTGAITVAESANENVAAAMEAAEVTNYVAYEITPEIAMAPGNYAVVSLPIPEDVTNPVVYYVSDDGLTVTDMNATDNGDGTVSFTTDHFSTYVVGNSTEITVPDPETSGTVTGTTTTTTKKTVYVLSSSISSGNSYLIANSASAGSVNLVANDGGDLSNTTATVVYGDCDGDGDSEYYIELTDATNELWTVSNSYRFQNDGYYLRYNNGLGLSTNNYTTWSYSNNRLSYRSNNSTRYLRYNNGWTTTTSSSSASSIYFYVPTEVDVETTTTTTGEYSIAGTPAEVTKVVESGTTVTLGSTLTFTPESGTATTTDTSTTATYTVVENGDPNGIISGINGNTVTFTGEYGKALVKVSYTVTVNDTDYPVSNYILITATEPVYEIDILDVAETSVTEVITVKGEDEMADGVYLNYKVTYTDAEDEKDYTVTDLTKITWTSSNTGIATVEKDENGNATVSFTGGEGLVQITVYYEYADGKTITDVISISVSKSQYTIPSDGTSDFPEYPAEGAVRINKTADAVGNFSETGIAQVELSMTGVPYTTGSEIDVVIMMDMTGSMSSAAMAAAEESAIVFAETIVKNEDGTYNNNRISVMAFNSSSSSPFTYWELGTITADEWDSFCTAVRGASDDQTSGGTPYDEALAKCREVLQAAKTDGTGNNRQQFCVFMSDGGPTSYQYITNYDAVKAGTATEYTTSTASASGGANQSDSNFATIAGYTHEYYSTLMKDDGVTVYSVLTGLVAANYPNCTTIMQNIASDSSKAYVVEDGTDTDELSGVLAGIGMEIKQAATNVVVEDKIGSDYTLNFSLPSGVTSTEAGMSEFYIQVVGYTLNTTTHEREGDPSVLENFTFNSDGTLKSHTVDGVACTDCAHVTIVDGKVTAIAGTYFNYTVDEAGDEYLTWTADKLDTTELALQYFAHLDGSTGENANSAEPGSYYTNEYATVTYTNFQGTECQKEFPMPQMTWKGAQVSYRFYLVNEDGQPVNRAGRVVPFAEAVWVTDKMTESVTWNDNEGVENMLAENLLASANVPDVYELYDTNAYYEIRVYQTEGVDDNAVNYNYFKISGSESGLASYETTKVYNTLAGTRYDDYGVYSEQAVGTVLNTTDANGNATTVTTTVKTDDIDYANTTVAFAVVWKPELQPDTVVIDYGLDVVINVVTNDALASGVVGVRTDAPANVTMNSGTYDAAEATSVDINIDGTKIATATVENIQTVRFSLDKTNGMQFTKPASFYYESDCNYYDNGVLKTDSMYSQVTVIPATTVYYEDEYVTTLEYHNKADDIVVSGIADGGWAVEGNTITATQAVDRPGAWQGMDPSYDANNEYGYDAAYNSSTTWSMGSALKVNVSGSDYAIAEFDFYGTGFDIISMTGNDTGTITVKVMDESGEVVKRFTVDTYYGYTYGIYKATYYWDGYNWFLVDVEETDETTLTEKSDLTPADAGTTAAFIEEMWQPCSTDEAIYQVPVIKGDLSDLGWGKYTVRINAAYSSIFDHVDGSDNYNFYLDAIRIYDPMPTDTDVGDTTAGAIYADDNEGWPEYKMVRDMLASEGFDATGTDEVAGVVFIDGGETSSVADYANYGPNNEVYLTNGQAVAFQIDNLANVADVQLGLKCATEGNVIAELSIYDGTTWVSTPGNIENTDSATDRYYSIGAYLDDIDAPIVVIKNTSSGILSITNVKTTYLSAPTEVTAASYRMSAASVNAVLMMLNAEPEEEAPVVLPDAELEVSVSSKSVKVGNKVTVKVTTSEDVDYLTVNGEEITEYKQNKKTGKRSWTVKVTPEEAGDMDIAVTAWSADGYELDTVTETVQVTEKKSGNVNKVIGQLLDKLFG